MTTPDQINPVIYADDETITIVVLFILLIILATKLPEVIKRFVFWMKWKKTNRDIRKRNKRKARIVYKNTREEFLKARKYKPK